MATCSRMLCYNKAVDTNDPSKPAFCSEHGGEKIPMEHRALVVSRETRDDLEDLLSRISGTAHPTRSINALKTIVSLWDTNRGTIHLEEDNE